MMYWEKPGKKMIDTQEAVAGHVTEEKGQQEIVSFASRDT